MQSVFFKKIISISSKGSQELNALKLFYCDQNFALNTITSEMLKQIPVICKRLGEGFFSKVYDCGNGLAVKVINLDKNITSKSQNTPEKIEVEINNLKQFQGNPHILHLHGAIKDGDKYYIFIENLEHEL